MTFSLQRLYEIYYFHFPYYMMTKNESFVLHIFLLSMAILLGYWMSSLPANFMFLLSRAYYYFSGSEVTAI